MPEIEENEKSEASNDTAENSLAKRINNAMKEASKDFGLPGRDELATTLVDRLEKAIFHYNASENPSDKIIWYEEGVKVFALLQRI